MKILGIGADIAYFPRFTRILQRKYPKNFIDKYEKDYQNSYALRFASRILAKCEFEEFQAILRDQSIADMDNLRQTALFLGTRFAHKSEYILKL